MIDLNKSDAENYAEEIRAEWIAAYGDPGQICFLTWAEQAIETARERGTCAPSAKFIADDLHNMMVEAGCAD